MMRLLFLLIIFIFTPFIQAAERVKWEQGKQISVELVVGEERKITFPEKVRFGVKARYVNQFSHSIIDNMFFVTPLSEFRERLTLQGLDSGKFYVLQTSVSDTSIKAQNELIIHSKKDVQSDNERSNTVIHNNDITPMDLVQFASQNLYSPNESLIEPTPGIRRVAIKKRSVLNLYRGGVFSANVLESWIGGGMYVTAIKLTNESNQTVKFEPCRIRGSFYSATAQFKHAMPLGSSKNFTVIYLLSEQPFDVAIQSRELLCV